MLKIGKPEKLRVKEERNQERRLCGSQGTWFWEGVVVHSGLVCQKILPLIPRCDKKKKKSQEQM